MSTLSTSLYGSSTNKGVGGLLSGLDTDDLVKQMTARTRNKINRQYQGKQKLQYRQEAYREVSSKLLAFSNKYFSYSAGSKTNILSPKFFESNTIESSSKYVNVTGDAENIKKFSITDIQSIATAATFSSNKVVSTQSFSSDILANNISSLAGETMSIKYDGKTYNLTLDRDFGRGNSNVTLDQVAVELNKQIEKIANLNGGTSNNLSDNILKYSVSADGKRLEITSTDPSKKATLAAASTKIIENLKFTVGEDSEAESTAPIEPIDLPKLTRTAKDVFTEGNMTFDLNGVKKTINLKGMVVEGQNTYTASEIATYLNGELAKAYGSGKAAVESTADGKVLFKTNEANNLLGVTNISSELGAFTGIQTGAYNRINQSIAIKDAGIKDLEAADSYTMSINGKDFTFKNTASLSEIINTINNDSTAGVKISYSSTTDKFSVTNKETGSHNTINIVGKLGEALFGKSGIDYSVKSGVDTVITYTSNGVTNTINRSTSNFSIDGINIELNQNAKGTASSATPITFGVTNNSDEVVERVKQFINDYNDIISLINTNTKQKPNKDYPVLTPEQRDDMKKEEIEKWEAESKKGILFGDSKINNVMNKLRTSMSGSTSVSEIILSNLGIAPANMDTSGKLVVDEKKLKEKLSQNPEQIAALFTGSSTDPKGIQGIAIQIQDILKENVGTFGTSGILIEEAGRDNSVSADQNYISKRMKEYDEDMAKLKKVLSAERQRYWNKFTALEKTMNSLNSQSSWLTNMMGS